MKVVGGIIVGVFGWGFVVGMVNGEVLKLFKVVKGEVLKLIEFVVLVGWVVVGVLNLFSV